MDKCKPRMTRPRVRGDEGWGGGRYPLVSTRQATGWRFDGWTATGLLHVSRRETGAKAAWRDAVLAQRGLGSMQCGSDTMRDGAASGRDISSNTLCARGWLAWRGRWWIGVGLGWAGLLREENRGGVERRVKGSWARGEEKGIRAQMNSGFSQFSLGFELNFEKDYNFNFV